MKTKEVVKLYLGGLLIVLAFFVVLPFMISSSNESIFAIGALLIATLGLFASILINNAIKKPTQEKKK